MHEKLTTGANALALLTVLRQHITGAKTIPRRYDVGGQFVEDVFNPAGLKRRFFAGRWPLTTGRSLRR